MSQTVAVSLPGCAMLLASDRRHSALGPAGELLAVSDDGGKLVRQGAAWLSYGGDLRHNVSVLAAVAETGRLDAECIAEISARKRADASITSRFLVLDTAGLSRVHADGRIEHWPADRPAALLEHPNEKGNGGPLARLLYSGLQGLAGRLYEKPVTPERRAALTFALVRLVAGVFCVGARMSPRVSPEVELALNGRYMRGRAVDFASADNSTLKCALAEPPAAVSLSAVVEHLAAVWEPGARLAADYSPSAIEAWVYVRETITGTRHFLNSFRLEDRDPEPGEETLTFTSGLDRLKVTVPPSVVTYIYPVDGSEGVLASVSYNATTKECTLGVSGTPFSTGNAANNPAAMRYEGLTGVLAGSNWYIASSGETDHSFVIVLEDAAQVPSVGDHFRIHSDVTTREEVAYAGADFESIEDAPCA